MGREVGSDFFFDKLAKNPNLIFFLEGGGGGEGREVGGLMNVSEQMFQRALQLLLFEEKNCA